VHAGQVKRCKDTNKRAQSKIYFGLPSGKQRMKMKVYGESYEFVDLIHNFVLSKNSN